MNVLSGPFRLFRHVGHGVGQSLTHILTHTVFPQKVTKPAEIIRFLLITNQLLYRLSYSSIYLLPTV